jgi:hypothetical protein
MICATCQRVLEVWTDADGATHRHTVQDADDHPVVPVPAPPGFTGGSCDFCNGGPVTHLVPLRDFEMPGQPGRRSGDSWAACEACVGLVDRSQWNGVLHRLQATWVALHGRRMSAAEEAHMQRIYRALRKNITGAARPIDEEGPS